MALQLSLHSKGLTDTINVMISGGATPGRARSNYLAKKLLPWLAPWLAPWLTEILTFGLSQSSQLMTCLTTVLTWK